ncbi:MAG: hypothetical protein ACYTG5_07975 [Planctomycetota bacterium]|jgi:hypothetical protein
MGGKLAALFKFMIVVAIVGSLGLRIYRGFIPDGAEFKAYAWESEKGPVFPAVGTQPELKIVFERTGDTKGGNYNTWVVYDHWLWGQKVVAQGYSSHKVYKQEEPFPLKWMPNGISVEVKFLDKAIGGKLETKTFEVMPVDG